MSLRKSPPVVLQAYKSVFFLQSFFCNLGAAAPFGCGPGHSVTDELNANGQSILSSNFI
jgi:hypothetical protein